RARKAGEESSSGRNQSRGMTRGDFDESSQLFIRPASPSRWMSTMSSTKPKILIQLDTDPQPSVFDAVVAVDSGVDHLFRHGGVTPANVRDLVYGALFTRGPAELHGTAIFIGGSNVAASE